jgi:hypothetical protein
MLLLDPLRLHLLKSRNRIHYKLVLLLHLHDLVTYLLPHHLRVLGVNIGNPVLVDFLDDRSDHFMI